MKKQFELSDITVATGGIVLNQKAASFSGLGTDTRKDMSGEIFIALRGPSFDAHDFLDKAVDQGATALIVDQKPSEKVLKRVTVIQVPDTLKALQDFGNYVRNQSKAKVLAITGSNGKTSTKEFAAQLISPHRELHYNKGSFNNHWGVPLTLLELKPEHEVLLSEMGMNHAGEIEELVKIAEPDVVLVTTVGRAHLEAFNNIEELARAKSEIYRFANPKATGVFNLDNDHTQRMYQAWIEERGADTALTYSLDASLEPTVFLSADQMNKDSMILSGRISDMSQSGVQVPVFGKQNISNLMAAACLALAAGLEPAQIWQSLPHCKTIWGRNQAVKLKSGADLIFDGYNANPDSMKALLENLSLIEGPSARYAVLGEMLEMGRGSAALHEELGLLAGQAGLDWVWFVGEHGEDFKRGLEHAGFSKSSVISKSYEEDIASQLCSMLKGQEIVLVKGSRGIGLEKVVFALDPIGFTAKA